MVQVTDIQPNAFVEAADGPVGRIRHLVVDRGTGQVTSLMVRQDGQDWLVPVGAVDTVQLGHVVLHGAWSAYQETDSVSYEDLEPVDDPKAGTAAARSDGAGTWQLQLLEERLRPTIQSERAGTVRIGTRVTQHVETVEVPLEEERVIVERRPGSGRAFVGDRELREGEVIEVPVMRQRAHPVKEMVVAEEVTVRKQVSERRQVVQGTVRREELAVDGQRGLVREGGDR